MPPKKVLGEKPGAIGETKVAPKSDRKPKAKAEPESPNYDVTGRGVARIDEADKFKTRVFLLGDSMYADIKRLAAKFERERKAADGVIEIDGDVYRSRITPSALARSAFKAFLIKYGAELK